MIRNELLVVILGLLFLYLFNPESFGQSETLARKGSLGVRLEAVNDERGQAVSLPEPKGAYITEVLPGSTGEALLLQAGDVILSIAGEATDDVQEVVRRTAGWRAGQALELEVWRGGKSISLQGVIRGKPEETSELAEVIYGSVAFRDGRLRSIIHKPKADGALPLVVFMQGFSCSSIDFYHFPGSPIRQLLPCFVEIHLSSEAAVNPSNNKYLQPGGTDH